MKTVFKIVVITFFVVILLLLLVKHEEFIERHYDTLEYRNRKQTTFLGVVISESIENKKGGYRAEYSEIYEESPRNDRWRSISKRPIKETHLFIVNLWSVMTPRGMRMRNEIAKDIFERYSEDQDPKFARQAFDDLETIIPCSDAHKITDYTELDSILNTVKATPSLQGLFVRVQDHSNNQSQQGEQGSAGQPATR